jgi:iron(II)-dependent oxidoreductase
MQGLLQDIARVIARRTITEPLGNAVSAGLTGLGAGSWLDGIGSWIGGLFRAEGGPACVVQLRALRLDRTEVTNAAFAEVLIALPAARPLPQADAQAGRVAASHLPAPARALLLEGRKGSDAYPLIAPDDEHARIALRGGRFVAEPAFAHHPVTGSAWRGAALYCAWRGVRLPSEVEWEAAARRTEGRAYPWGNATPTAAHAVIGRRSGQTEPVGSRPAGATPEGVHDLAGSVQEWTSSLYRPLPWRADDGREDPRAVTHGGDHVHDDTPQRLLATHRTGFSHAPERGHRHIGFRCAADG